MIYSPETFLDSLPVDAFEPRQPECPSGKRVFGVLVQECLSIRVLRRVGKQISITTATKVMSCLL